ncbi:MAG: CRISPR-associated endonuclease Cas2 [Deltaproteobacteria bacterium]|nr:CRISPR-associated endonuclease Cas2 [Deltaproteobacteria bacterium]
MFYLICFDIVDDRLRARVAKVLKGSGERVQKSVFECQNLSEEKFLKLKAKLEKIINSGEDSVRYYRLCRKCVHDVELSGIGEIAKIKDFEVI